MVTIISALSAAVIKIVYALVVYVIGRFVITKVMGLLDKSKLFDKFEGSIRTFFLSFIRILLYVILIISIVKILGIDTASIVAVLASAGLAIGMALQGALSNLAGGIMLMIFKPFKVGDYIEASGVEGIVQEITMFYTSLLTLDNKRVTVPNGGLMNANITDYSAEEIRRVDLVFACGKGEEPARIQNIIVEAMSKNEKVLQDPAPFASVSGGTSDTMEFTARSWCRTEDYWDVYFLNNQLITEAFGANNVKFPEIRITDVSK